MNIPMNIQDRFPLGSTGWISLQSKGLSRVFSNLTRSKVLVSHCPLQLVAFTGRALHYLSSVYHPLHLSGQENTLKCRWTSSFSPQLQLFPHPRCLTLLLLPKTYLLRVKFKSLGFPRESCSSSTAVAQGTQAQVGKHLRKT